MTLGPLSDKRFLIIAGKGGVGKSTMCTALGLAAAKAGKRTVIAELNTREKAAQFFGKPPSGYRTQELVENLFSINIQPEPALREYGLMKLKFERVYKLVFENDAMKRLVRMIPGMNELFLLGKAFNLERERNLDGSPTWDMVIVDAPATGHGVSLLRLPQVILEVAKSGPMAQEVGEMRRLLTDPTRTAINLVSLPEEMPVKETIELAGQIDELLSIPTGYLIVNGIYPRLLSGEERRISHGLRHVLSDARSGTALACLESIEQRRDLQDTYLGELRRAVSGLPMIEVPFLFSKDFGEEAITTISGHLSRALAGYDVRTSQTTLAIDLLRDGP